jgi:hypothetical protein
MTVRGALLTFGRSVFGSPQYDRLRSSIEQARTRYQWLVAAGPGEASEDWAKAAAACLGRADQHLDNADLEMGWMALEDANEWMLHAKRSRAEFDELAHWVHREAKSKLSGWRAQVVSDLLCDDKGRLRKKLARQPERLIQAKRVLTDQVETTQHRIALRRRHLQYILLFLVGSLAAAIVLSLMKKLPGDLSNTSALASVMVGGAIGACISVIQGMMKAGLDKRIPDQLVGAFVIWIRPVLGCATAVSAFGLVQANKTMGFINLNLVDDPRVLFAVALLAGYSERFIVGAFGRLADSLGAEK